MSILGNIIWLLFGGLATAMGYFAASIPFFISIIGIPFGVQAVKLGILQLWPFGSRTYQSEQHSGGLLYTILNVIWFIIAGIPICLTHLFFGVLLGITIIGIPFAKQHFKMAGLALNPFGKKIAFS